MYIGSRDYMTRSTPISDLIYQYPRNYYRPLRKNQPLQHDYLYQDQSYYLSKNSHYLKLKEQEIMRQRQKIIAEKLIHESCHKNKSVMNQINVDKMKIKNETKLRSSSDKKMNQQKNYRRHESTHHLYTLPYQQKMFQNQQKQQNRVTKSTGLGNDNSKVKQSQNIKNKIFKKLHETPQKINNLDVIEVTSLINEQKNDMIVLKEEIYFLKQQLQQKNKLIVDLQCDLLKKTKLQQLTFSKKLNTTTYHNQIDKSYKSSLISSTKSNYNITNIKQKKLTVNSKNIDMIILTNQNKEKNKNLSITPQISYFNFKVDDRETKQSFFNCQVPSNITEQAEIQTQDSQLHRSLKQQLINTDYPKQNQSEVIPQRNNSLFLAGITQSIYMRNQSLDSQIDLTLSASVVPEQRRVYHKKSEDIISNFTNKQSLIIQLDKENEDVSTQTQAKQITNQQSQTSQNLYDYIEQTYLDWVFDKQFKELQQKKQKERLNSQSSQKSKE